MSFSLQFDLYYCAQVLFLFLEVALIFLLLLQLIAPFRLPAQRLTEADPGLLIVGAQVAAGRRRRAARRRFAHQLGQSINQNALRHVD